MLKDGLLDLGYYLSQHMDSTVLKITFFSDKDFLDRTALRHICDYEYEPMLRFKDVQGLITQLWDGEHNCNGSAEDYSLLSYLSNT